jgi:hypothetical protein
VAEARLGIRILTASDVPGVNGFAIFPEKDQPVFAEGHVRFRGEAVMALVDRPRHWQGSRTRPCRSTGSLRRPSPSPRHGLERHPSCMSAGRAMC